MKLTANVADEQSFYVKDGPKISSVKQLAEALEKNSISDDSFNYHINNNNNDFVNWIKDVFQNDKLAKSLKRVKARKTFINKLNEELNSAPSVKKSKATPAKPAAKSAKKPSAQTATKPAGKKKK